MWYLGLYFFLLFFESGDIDSVQLSILSVAELLLDAKSDNSSCSFSSNSTTASRSASSSISRSILLMAGWQSKNITKNCDIVITISFGAGRSSEVERSIMVRWVIGSILHGVDPLSYFSFQPVLHDWCNKGRGMCYPVCGMVHIKEPLMLIDKSSLCGSSGFSFSLSEWCHITVDKMCWVCR